jgi:CubicO group peptidase (beta-lactamase class C family)
MSPTKNTCTLLSMLILISLLFTALPVKSASAQRFSLVQVDKDRIDAYIQARMEAANIPGLALGVVYGDQAVYLKGYGFAGPDGRPVTPQTSFILGSTSKSFTALAVMQLVEAGQIDLDARVTKYLPWFRTGDAAASGQITVRHLLHQNSGLPTYAGRQGIADNDQSRMALEKGVRALSSVQLSQPAGQGYEYANENYDILGLIVQTVSGKSYEEYVRSAIFAPLQMSHSAAALSDPAAKDLATGYRNWLFWPVAFAAPYPRRTTPSGFLISSAEDMTHYVSAQLNSGMYGHHQLLSPQGMATLHTPGAKMSPLRSYGMGWVIEGEPGATKLWHNGDVSNFHSNLLLLPDQHIGIVILINASNAYNNAALNIPIEGVAAILLGKSLPTSTNPLVTAIPQMMMLATLLIPLLWIVESYRSIKRWRQRGELPPHGVHRFWRLYLPLTIDVSPLGLAWILFPAQVHTPMATIALFAPDVFVVIVTLTVLCLGWAMARLFLTLAKNKGNDTKIVKQIQKGEVRMTSNAPLNRYRRTAAVVGAIYLAGFVVGIGGEALFQSVLSAPNHLALVAANSLTVTIGALLWLITVVGDAAHGVLMYPVLKPHNERIAVGYLAARIMVLFVLLQIPLGSTYLQTAPADLADLLALSNVLIQAKLYVYDMGMITLGISGILLCYTLYRTKLVPRLLAVWGLVGYAIIFGGMVSEVMGSGLGLASSIPGGLWEVFIGVWLIVKGFNAPVIASTPAQTVAKGSEQMSLSNA